jgi:hypothetical protein
MLWAFPDSSAATEQLRRVDYDKPLELIYTEFTTATFVKTNGSTVQLYLVNSLPRLASLPSWIPDWSQTNSMSYLVWISKLRDFRAARESLSILLEKGTRNQFSAGTSRETITRVK